MTLPETGDLVGFAGLHYIDGILEVNLGYALRRDLWRRGFGAQACRAALAVAAGLGLDEVVTVIDPANLASRRLAESLGFALWQPTTWSGLPRLIYRGQVGDEERVPP